MDLYVENCIEQIDQLYTYPDFPDQLS